MRVRDVPLPEYQSEGAAAFDLAPAESTLVPARKSVMAPTGLVIEIPPGHMGLIVPRSSTWNRHRISLGNTVGVIDSDFCGPDDEMKLNLHSFRDDDLILSAGTRLAQFIIVPIVRAALTEVDSVTNTTRGGWGSSG